MGGYFKHGKPLDDNFLHETRLQADGDTVHLAGDFVVAIHQADRFRLGPDLENLRGALQFQVLDHRYHISIREHVAVGVLDDSVCGGSRVFRRHLDLPIITASDTLEVVRVRQNICHLAHRAGGSAHRWPRKTTHCPNSSTYSAGIFQTRGSMSRSLKFPSAQGLFEECAAMKACHSAV